MLAHLFYVGCNIHVNSISQSSPTRLILDRHVGTTTTAVVAGRDRPSSSEIAAHHGLSILRE